MTIKDLLERYPDKVIRFRVQGNTIQFGGKGPGMRHEKYMIMGNLVGTLTWCEYWDPQKQWVFYPIELINSVELKEDAFDEG